jgi:hypothetical protein
MRNRTYPQTQHISARHPEPAGRDETRQRLCTRRQAAHILGDVSIATVQRLEAAGKLTRIRLRGTTGMVMLRLDQVVALAQEGDDA